MAWTYEFRDVAVQNPELIRVSFTLYNDDVKYKDDTFHMNLDDLAGKNPNAVKAAVNQEMVKFITMNQKEVAIKAVLEQLTGKITPD